MERKERQKTAYRMAKSVVATFGEQADWTIESTFEANESSENVGLTRGQRKRQKRNAAFLKKMGLVTRLTKANEAKEKKKRKDGVFGDLKELETSLLLENTSSVCDDTNKKRSKSQSAAQRRKMAAVEVRQLLAVKAHPAFVEDPFSAIKTHLQNTVLASLPQELKTRATL
uniref:Uncharacterized protein AlNc14C38G3318 n=1 Tax=Albugo laibachii Nc14 TaxID=890382 RepID=F0W952_9STRA|nr:conserved hypothetical protein [Albugo laibachii Nc14]|eukprot:CCA17664.1 conserved hypothetical protein [Albugo laibachii Nc14]